MFEFQNDWRENLKFEKCYHICLIEFQNDGGKKLE